MKLHPRLVKSHQKLCHIHPFFIFQNIINKISFWNLKVEKYFINLTQNQGA